MSEDAIFEAIALFRGRGLLRNFRSNVKGQGCYLYGRAGRPRAYRARRAYRRVRVSYGMYKHACYLPSRRVPRFRLPPGFRIRGVGYIIANVYKGYLRGGPAGA